MSSHPLSSSPIIGISSELPSSPTTPSPSMRPRNVNRIQGQNSMTASSSEPSPVGRTNDIPRSTFRSLFASSPSTPVRRIVVRSDPALLTCFDPQDKELYDLWAPRK